MDHHEMSVKGGKARAASMTKEERSKLGKIAIAARWKKAKAAKRASRQRERIETK